VLYFAYASNMNPAQMKRWCPASGCQGRPASSFRFVYDGFSVTWTGRRNIVKSEPRASGEPFMRSPNATG